MADMQKLSVRLEKSGRILIPVAIRRQLGLKEGESDVLLEVGDTQPLVITARSQALKNAQETLRSYAAGRKKLVSEELIAERRREARRERAK
jgi:AbrB family looped-hinge helix DNA binding protein